MVKRNVWLAMVLAAVCVLAEVADAQDKSIRRLEPGRKMALVIGNAAYTTQLQLKNPVNDAQAVARLLREELGFAEEHVQLRLNLETGRAINQALDGFAEGLQAKDLAFFYYSGHGGQERESRENYLLPTGFKAVKSKTDLQYDALKVTKVLDRLAGAQLRVVVVDACRTNGGLVDEEVKTGDAPKGLAATEIDPERLGDMRGELIAYAASPGQVATDRGAGVGVYARHLVAELRRPGVVFWEAFRRVGDAVHRETGGKQHPTSVHRLYGAEFYFVPGKGPVVSGTGSGTGGGGVVRPPVVDPWVRDWQVLEGIEDPALKGVVKAYIEDYESEADARLWVMKAEVLLAKLEKIGPGPGGGSGQSAAGSSWESPLGMEFAWVPAGRFVMGSPDGEEGRDGNEVQHEVRISEGFWMGRYEVTQGEWEEVMGSNPSMIKACGPRCPVEQVSWFDAEEFIRRLNRREAGSGYAYRLPTEAEWEYAARAGSTGATPEGELRILGKNNAPVLDGQAWYAGNAGVTYASGRDCSKFEETQYEVGRCGTHPVGLKRGNAWGLYDMLGSVWEWTGDWYGAYPSGMVTDPRGPSTGSDRVARGGGWRGLARVVRSADRSYASPGDRSHDIGFRLVRTK